MFKSKERTGHQTLWSLSLPQNMFLQILRDLQSLMSVKAKAVEHIARSAP